MEQTGLKISIMQIGRNWQVLNNQKWYKNMETLRHYFNEQCNGEKIVFENEISGYITARMSSDCLTLAVELYEDCGGAHKIYIRNGSIPDGGAGYSPKNKASFYNLYSLADDLVTYLKKERYYAV